MSSEWSNLETVAEIIDSLHKTPVYSDIGQPMVRVTDVKYGILNLASTFKVDSDVFDEFSRRYKPKQNDIVITRVGSFGITALVKDTNFCLGQNTAAIVPTSINPRYLYAALNSPLLREQIEASAVGSTQKTLSLKCIKLLKIPRLGQQSEDAVAELIGSLDDRIALLRETNATLEAIAQALFKSWFVDFDPVYENQGANAAALENKEQTPSLPPEIQALFPATFNDSPQGPIPEGWERVTLDKISEVGIGKTPPRKEQHWFSESSSDTRWVSIRDMGMCGAYIATTSEFLTKEAVERFNVRVVPTNTVMLSFKMTIGRVAISDGAMTTNEAIAHFKLSEKSPISSEVIYLHLKSFDYSTLSSTSSIADAVNSKTVKNIPILLADASVLAEFQNRIEPIFGKIKVIEQQVQTLITLRDTLLPRLISGQLRLPEAEQAIAAITD